MQIWVHSWSTIRAQALVVLLASFGFTASDRCTAGSDIALWDLLGFDPLSYPDSPNLPTIALVLGDEWEVHELLLRGYSGYLGASSTARQLRQALEAVYHGEIWAERKLVARAFASVVMQEEAQRDIMLKMLKE